MIRLIAAIDRKRGIAKMGYQPWYIPEDSQNFSLLTKSCGGMVLIGGTTFKLMDGPLKGRHNFILSREKTPIDNVELVNNLEKFLDDWQSKDLWIIGGANVFTQVMELQKADELYLTKIEADFGCNQFFPGFDDDFVLSEKSNLQEQNGFIFSYTKYTRKVLAT